MKIDGIAIAEKILAFIASEIVALKQRGATPTLAVIQVGDDPASTAYIRQKQKAAEQIGAKLILSHQSSAISRQTLQNLIQQYNDDHSVHGVILQRPLPPHLANTSMYQYIKVNKDVDGFLPNSPYPVPVAAAVLEILRVTFSLFTFHFSLEETLNKTGNDQKFKNWLITKKTVVLGRGETAGKPITEGLLKRGCNVIVIHSHTPNPDDIIKTGDIVISCVGKPNVVRRDNIKAGAVLVSVGISRDASGKLHGDYEEEAIKSLASFYTPTPGGVGPVNVAYLMVNLLQAASKLL